MSMLWNETGPGSPPDDDYGPCLALTTMGDGAYVMSTYKALVATFPNVYTHWMEAPPLPDETPQEWSVLRARPLPSHDTLRGLLAASWGDVEQRRQRPELWAKVAAVLMEDGHVEE